MSFLFTVLDWRVQQIGYNLRDDIRRESENKKKIALNLALQGEAIEKKQKAIEKSIVKLEKEKSRNITQLHNHLAIVLQIHLKSSWSAIALVLIGILLGTVLGIQIPEVIACRRDSVCDRIKWVRFDPTVR
jgi:hypothetical protein